MENDVAAPTQPDLRPPKWDAFLTFRGADTRRPLIAPLYDTLRINDIRAFLDIEGMNRGDQIGQSILAAIEDSAMAIVVISPGFATSSWCLEVLAKICECGKLMILVFYGVEPSDVRYQKGPFRDSFERLAERHGDAKVSSWKAAMAQAGGVSAFNFSGQDDQKRLHTFIAGVVRELQLDLKGKKRLGSKLVGVDDRSVRRRITSWQKGRPLGSGSGGTVYEAITDDGFFFAVKEVSLLDQEGKQSYLEQEISLLSRFQHENIVQYLGTDKDDEKLYIFLEYMTGGSLATLYKKYNLSDSLVSAYTRQILNGLEYLHDRNVIHRDIKCANVLVDVSGSVKLADLGLAKEIKLNDAKSCKGSTFWMAPEVINLKNTGYGLAADIWSLGCTVLEMLTRQHPYPHLEGVQAAYRTGKGELPPVPDSLSGDARNFIIRCLQVNPNDRPSAVQLLDDPFVRKPPIATSSGFASPRFDNLWS